MPKTWDKWTLKEKKLVEKLYPATNWDILLKFLPKRSKEAIAAMAGRIKIPRRRRWTLKEEEFIAKNWMTATDKEMAKFLKRGIAATGIRRFLTLGLNRRELSRRKDRWFDENDNLISKKCSKCKKNKLINAFARSCGGSDGYCRWCRECTAIYRKKRKTDGEFGFCTKCKEPLGGENRSKLCIKCWREKGLINLPNGKKALKCSSCNEIKLLKKFNKNTKNKNKHCIYCRKCEKMKEKRWRQQKKQSGYWGKCKTCGSNLSKGNKMKLCRKCIKGPQHFAWKGRAHSGQGYMKVMVEDHPYASKGKYVQEHRIIMEQWLREKSPNHPALIEIDGEKYLRQEWIVHHKNGRKDDNRILNLELWLKSHPKGQRYEDILSKKPAFGFSTLAVPHTWPQFRGVSVMKSKNSFTV